MTSIGLILVARAIHIIAGVTWAGAAFVLASVIVPTTLQHAADGAGRWTALISRKLGPMMGISALLTILSGVYLFAVLHAHDESRGAVVLGAGALAAILSLVAGAVIGRPAGLKLQQLSESSAPGAAAATHVSEQIAGLRRRVALGSRLTASLLGLSVLAMALFRYAQVLA